MKYKYLENELSEILQSNPIAIEHKISSLFFREKDKHPDDKDELEVIANFMSMNIDCDDKASPYKPLYILEAQRTFALDDISPDMANFLWKNIEKNIDNNIILSRIFDALWVTKKLGKNNVSAGEKACRYYLDYIKWLLENGNYYQAGEIVKRYISLGLSLPKSSIEYHNVFENYEEWIKYSLTSDNEYFLRTIYSLYYDKLSLGEKDAEIAEIVLKSAESYIDENISNDNDLLLEIYVYIIDRITRKTHQFNRRDDVWLKFGKYYIGQSEKAENLYNQVIFLQKSNECLRRIPGLTYKKLIDDNQMKIDQLQKKIPENMHVVKSKPVDISKEVNLSIQKISGKKIFESLLIIAQSMSWITEDYIKKNSCESVIEKYCGCISYNHNGQPQNTSAYSVGEQRCVDLYYQLHVQTTVDPMLKIFNQEHFFTKLFLLDIVRTHPFIPHGYEETYALGLYYFLTRNFFEASHILIPAFENSLRHLLSQRRPTTYFKKSDLELNRIKIQDFVQALAEEHVINPVVEFNVMYFFGDKEWNIRNELMHGLVPYECIYSHRIIISLLCIYWFVMCPYLQYEQDKPTGPSCD